MIRICLAKRFTQTREAHLLQTVSETCRCDRQSRILHERTPEAEKHPEVKVRIY